MNVSFGCGGRDANGGFDFEEMVVYEKQPDNLNNPCAKPEIFLNEGLSVIVHVINL